MNVFGSKFTPVSLVALLFIGRTIYNSFWNHHHDPMSRRTTPLQPLEVAKSAVVLASRQQQLDVDEMKKEYEAKLAEQLRLHKIQMEELVKSHQQQQQQSDQTSATVHGEPSPLGEEEGRGGDEDTTTGAAAAYQLNYYPYTLKGHQYFLPAYAMTRPAVKSFLRGQYYEPQTHCIMDKLLHRFPGSMVHAGTFFGDMIPHFATIIKNVSTPEHDYQLYSFEPNTRNYLLAQKAVEANELSNVVLVNAALGPTVMQQRIKVVGSESNGGMELGGGSAVSPDSGTQRVPQLVIDMFNITDLTVIALDTEGFEAFVLQGAMQTLKNTVTRPLVVALEDNSGKGTDFMKENLPEYILVNRKSGLSYFALATVQKQVQKLLQKNC